MEVHLFIFGYFFQLFASSTLLWQIWRRRSVYGISEDTFHCYLISTLARVVWSLDTRLTDSFTLYFELFGSIGVGAALCYFSYAYRHTTIKQAPVFLKAWVLTPVALLLAVLFHPGVARLFTVQVLVAFTMYLEALALLPQLYLMRTMIEVEAMTSNYVALIALSRLVRLFFWMFLYRRGEHFLGLILADVFHTIVTADYLQVWIRKLRTSGPIILTTSKSTSKGF